MVYNTKSTVLMVLLKSVREKIIHLLYRSTNQITPKNHRRCVYVYTLKRYKYDRYMTSSDTKRIQMSPHQGYSDPS